MNQKLIITDYDGNVSKEVEVDDIVFPTPDDNIVLVRVIYINHVDSTVMAISKKGNVYNYYICDLILADKEYVFGPSHMVNDRHVTPWYARSSCGIEVNFQYNEHGDICVVDANDDEILHVIEQNVPQSRRARLINNSILKAYDVSERFIIPFNRLGREDSETLSDDEAA